MSKLFRKSARREGFTLIELIVVITILGILALIAIPRLGAFRQQAVDKRLESNYRIAYGAAAMWLASHGDEIALVTWLSGNVLDVTGVTHDGDWRQYLESWPKDITSVTITDGVISVLPKPPTMP